MLAIWKEYLAMSAVAAAGCQMSDIEFDLKQDMLQYVTNAPEGPL